MSKMDVSKPTTTGNLDDLIALPIPKKSGSPSTSRKTQRTLQSSPQAKSTSATSSNDVSKAFSTSEDPLPQNQPINVTKTKEVCQSERGR